MKLVAVHSWPGALPVRTREPLVISIAHAPGTSRALARERIRLALREAVACMLGQALDRVTVQSVPGCAPRLMVDGQPGAGGVSISHVGALSIGAYHAGGRVGVDVMEVGEMDDWRAVARDYLGPQALAQLEATAPAQRALAFAQAWSAREAQLKCLGLALEEWHALPAMGQCCALGLPDGFAGTLALGVS